MKCTPTVIKMLDALTPLEVISVSVEMVFKAVDIFVEVSLEEKQSK